MDARSKKGLIDDANGVGTTGGTEASYRTMTNDLFNSINQAGGF